MFKKIKQLQFGIVLWLKLLYSKVQKYADIGNNPIIIMVTVSVFVSKCI